MILQYLDPGRVEARRRPGLAAVLDRILHHTADCRLTLIMRALPLLIDRAELVPVGALGGGPILGVGRGAVRERYDPILQQIALGIWLHVDGHVLVMRGFAPLRLEIIVLAAVRSREYGRARRAGFDRRHRGG